MLSLFKVETAKRDECYLNAYYKKKTYFKSSTEQDRGIWLLLNCKLRVTDWTQMKVENKALEFLLSPPPPPPQKKKKKKNEEQEFWTYFIMVKHWEIGNVS